MAYLQVAGTHGTGFQGATTSGLNFTGVDLIIIGQISYTPVGTSSVSDNLGNTYTPLTSHVATVETTQLFYCQSPTVGTSQKFTPGNSSADIYVVGFSGSAASPVDVQGGNSASGTSSIAPGLTTPNLANELVIVFAAYYSGTGTPSNGDVNYTVVDANPFASSVKWGGGLWYEIQTSATATNPTISWSTGAVDATACIAVFKSAAVTLFFATLSDSAASTDATAGAGKAAGALGDTAATTDATSGQAKATATTADTATATDGIAGAGKASWSIGDLAAASDAVSGASKATAALSDVAATSDSLTGYAVAAALLSDAALAGDLITAIAQAAYTLSDGALTDDGITSTARMVAAIFDAAVSSDAIGGAARASLSDTSSGSDATASVANFIAGLNDAAASSDAMSFVKWLQLLQPIVAPLLVANILRVGVISATDRVGVASDISRVSGA